MSRPRQTGKVYFAITVGTLPTYQYVEGLLDPGHLWRSRLTVVVSQPPLHLIREVTVPSGTDGLSIRLLRKPRAKVGPCVTNDTTRDHLVLRPHP